MALRRSGFKLELKPVSALRPHEETIPSHVHELADQCERDGVQKDPVLVDSETGSIVDGMHRLAAFKLLGLRNVVCCSFDYNSESISVYRWARAYSGAGVEGLLEAAKSAGISRATSSEDALRELEGKGSGLSVLSSHGALMPKTRIGLDAAFSVVRALDSVAAAKDLSRKFVSEGELEAESARRDSIAVLVEKLSKGDVIEAARTGRLFPCKTSMHVIDPRPVAVNFPLADLANEARIKDVDSKSPGRIAPPGTLYEGRRYKERLLLLDQD